MLKLFVSLGLTIMLGPGAGHLYLRRFKRGGLLIAATLGFAFHLAWRVSKTVAGQSLASISPSQVFQNFTLENPGIVFYYDVAFAAIWAFALVDAWQEAVRQLPPPETEQQDT